MVILLIGTFTFFGIHTIMWFPRAMKERKKIKGKLKESINEDGKSEQSRESEESTGTEEPRE